MTYEIYLEATFGGTFRVAVFTAPCEEGSRLVDEIVGLPCYRSAELLSQYFCVKHGVSEYFVPEHEELTFVKPEAFFAADVTNGQCEVSQ